MSDWAKKTADKYIRSDGRPPDGRKASSYHDAAEAAWRANAEIVHRFLRRKENLNDAEGREALFAFQRIGDGVNRQHKRFLSEMAARQ